MGCGELTYYEPGSEPDKCGVTIVTGGEVFECNVCQIARLRAEIERFKTRAMERAIEANERDARIAKLEAECEALRADVVWVARVGICQFVNGENVLFTMTTPTIFMRHDGTPADILRAVREARDGVS